MRRAIGQTRYCNCELFAHRSMGLGQCIDKVVEGSDWKNRFSGWDQNNRKLPTAKVSAAAVHTSAARVYQSMEQHAAVGRTASTRFDRAASA